MINERTLRLEYNLQWFAKDGPGGEKTEPATAKKLKDARDEGQVSKSRELTSAFELITLFLVLKIFISYVGNSFMDVFRMIYNLIPDFIDTQRSGLTLTATSSLFTEVFLQMFLIALPFLAFGFVISFLVNVLQVGFKVSTKPLQPKFDKFNPINGFKRILSKDSIFELLKSILKIALIFYVAYISVRDEANDLFLLYDIPLNQALTLIGDIIINTGLRISIVYLIIGLADFLYQRHKFSEDMKMTKQEVKDEYKNSEGDPQIKGKQKQRMREASQRRMMQDVPKADVVITNPTHLSVAIRYEAGVASAPIVVAKGEDYVALKIREVAKENNVAIMENKPLARALYATVDIGQQIPPELYQAVAEILAVVYNR